MNAMNENIAEKIAARAMHKFAAGGKIGRQALREMLAACVQAGALTALQEAHKELLPCIALIAGDLALARCKKHRAEALRRLEELRAQLDRLAFPHGAP
jgi:hypothetical protein